MGRLSLPRLLSSAALLAITALAAPKNVADPGKHPYADPAKGRSGHTFTDAKDNEARLYDFPQRQADYYLDLPERPAILPAFPGLDADRFGHWGKYNQNGYKDGRRNSMDCGGIVEDIFVDKGIKVRKALMLELGEPGGMGACFDAASASYPRVWTGGFVTFDDYRWALTSGGKPVGKPLLSEAGSGWRAGGNAAKTAFNGLWRYGRRTVFDYAVGDIRVYEQPWSPAGSQTFRRRFLFPAGGPEAELVLGKFAGTASVVAGRGAGLRLTDGTTVTIVDVSGVPAAALKRAADGTTAVSLQGIAVQAEVVVSIWRGSAVEADAALAEMASFTPAISWAQLTGGSPARWPERLTTGSEPATGTGAYVIDRVAVPFDNPYKSVMMLSGIDFFTDGTAAVCTLMGDVWLVSGLGKEMKTPTWRRIAAGLGQPFGLRIIDGQINLTTREFFWVLRDLNGDGEIDRFDCRTLDFEGLDRSHTNTFGLELSADGNFYYVGRELLYATPAAGGPTRVIADGVRNCMGLGLLPDGRPIIAPQEGTWTPASMILAPRPDDYFGFSFFGKDAQKPFTPPMCFIPRGIDCSTGGMLSIADRRFGPLAGGTVAFSYGYGTWYQILVDQSPGIDGRPQGAVVPIPGDFRSGTVRAAINPGNGQLYVVGTEGWGNYASQDGSLDRIRYTGDAFRQIVGYQSYNNGLRIDLASPVGDNVDANRFLAQMWGYLYSKGYGSPEFSNRKPDEMGHDLLTVKSVRVLNGGKSLFVEIPDLEPAMQLYLRGHLRGADGVEFAVDLFFTITRLAPPYMADGLAAVNLAKPQFMEMRMKGALGAGVQRTVSGEKDDHARQIVVETLGGMKYDTTEIEVTAGESLALLLKNQDIMPHNLVIVAPDAYEKIGLASFQMVNDPAGADRYYVPDDPAVLAYTFMVQPNGEHTTWFRAPAAPGRYPFFCTFPGHWQLMKGVLIVKPAKK